MTDLLYVLTTDNGDRESGSVWYANYLLVEASDDQKPAVDEAFARVMEIQEDASLSFPFDGDEWEDTASFLHSAPNELVRRMAEEGWTVRWVQPQMITQYEN